MGRTFPDYKGPLTRAVLVNLCYFCGESSVGAVRIGQSRVGVCKKHMERAKKDVKKVAGGMVKEETVQLVG